MRFRTAAVLILGSSCWWSCAPSTDPLPEVVPLSRASTVASLPIPNTLDEALDALEHGGSGEFHRLMRSDDENIAASAQYGVITGWDRWGLGDGSPLDAHLSSLGISRPWEMREAILRAYWRRLHHRPLDIESLVRAFAERFAKEEQMAASMGEQEEQLKTRMKSMTMGLLLVPASRPSIRLGRRNTDGMDGRYLAAYGGGVLIGMRHHPEPDSLTPYFSDGLNGIAPVRIRGVDNVRSFIVAKDGLWVAGVTSNHPILLRIGTTREQLEFPRQDIAQLGIDDQQQPIAIYTDAVFRWTDGHWTLARGEMKLPKTVMPPRLLNSTLFVRDEGAGENDKRLWWTAINGDGPLISHDQAIGFGWFDALSYLFTRTGEFWFTTGNSPFEGWTLVRRSRNGEYKLATNGGQLTMVERHDESVKPVVNISAIAELANGQLVGAGSLGFYRIEADRIVTIVGFRDASQITDTNLQWRWDPTDILELSPNRYLIIGLFGGIYQLDLSGDNNRLIELDERILPSIEL